MKPTETTTQLENVAEELRTIVNKIDQFVLCQEGDYILSDAKYSELSQELLKACPHAAKNNIGVVL